MHFGFSIGIYDCKDIKIETAIIDMMSDEGLDFVERDELWQDVPHQDTLNYFLTDGKSMLRKFLIAPNKNRWCRIYPATSWFSEVQEFAIDLSRRLNGTAMTLLKDDSSGWGYELSQNGNLLDKFHTNPLSSETLEERRELGVPQPEIKEEDYKGNPSLITSIFGVNKNKVTTNDMYSFFDLLNIEYGDAEYRFFSSSSDLERHQINIDEWYHLTFIRKLTVSEIRWCQDWLAKFQEDFPDNPAPAPPLWLYKT